MTIEKHGNIRVEKKITVEAIRGGTRTTVVETDELEKLDPEEFESDGDYGVVVSSVVSRQNEAYDVKTTVYEDIKVSTSDFKIRVSAVVSEEPIETHPAFSEKVDGYPIILAGKGDAKENGAVFKGSKEDSEFDYFPPNADGELGGVSSYLVPSIIMEASKTFATFGEVGWDQIYDIGKIKAPPEAINVGNNRNWLLVGVLYENEGGDSWTVTNQYQLSGDKGWNENLYRSA